MIYLAPMMGYTHGWFRAMIQALHPGVEVMTEMVSLAALKHKRHHPTLWQHPLERGTSIQIATGCDKEVRDLLGYLDGLPYTHINLNAGCPSPQVGKAKMGAILMHHPALTRSILSELRTLDKKISLKTRLGVDDKSDADWEVWLEAVLTSGIGDVFLHARIALLEGLNPAQNRSIPPLRYERAREIFSQYPSINWVINGGINEFSDVLYWRHTCLGVMLGRVAYQNPMLMYRLALHDGLADPRRLKSWFDSVEDTPLTAPIITCLLALCRGFSGAKALRETITEHKDKRWDAGRLYDALLELMESPALCEA